MAKQWDGRPLDRPMTLLRSHMKLVDVVDAAQDHSSYFKGEACVSVHVDHLMMMTVVSDCSQRY